MSFCASGSTSPARDAQLPLDEVLASDALGDRVLDLEACVHLHEVELVRVAVENELDRAGADILDGARGVDGRRAHLVAQLGRHAGRRRLLDHLLVAALHRAVALAQVNGVAVLVGKHLKLNMARTSDIFFDEKSTIAKRSDRLARRRSHGVFELGVSVSDAHALATTTHHSLDENRITDAIGFTCKSLHGLILAVIAWHHWHIGIGHDTF
jgi:hypothetical protein